jgi:hypothetical protein
VESHCVHCWEDRLSTRMYQQDGHSDGRT